MNIQIITISPKEELHQPWGIRMDETKYNLGNRKNINPVKKYYIESDDENVLQKIKIGHPLDNLFDPMFARVGPLYKGDGISQQSIQVPYSHIYTNPKTLNLFLSDPILNENEQLLHSDYVDHGMCDGVVILLLGKDYKYIRSSVNENICEIIATFYTKDVVGCILLLNNKGIKEIPNKIMENLKKKPEAHETCPEMAICCDTSFTAIDPNSNKDIIHIRLNITKDQNSDTYLYPMIGETAFNVVKNPVVIERLHKLLENDQKNTKRERKFLRCSKKIITNYFVVSNTFMGGYEAEDETNNFQTLIDNHGFSSAVDLNNEVVVFTINTDEKGYIIEDNTFREVLDYMKGQKIKGFTLVNCKVQGAIFNELRPSYIFIIDETELVMDNDSIKPLKCLRSN